MADKLDLESKDLIAEKLEQLQNLFPNLVTEGANGKVLDLDQLQNEFSTEVVEGTKERYRLEWPGKKEAIVTTNLPTTKTLRPVKEDSVDWENTENLYIEGDNLEVLKILQESYFGKIKMIYIDPPYNTGEDFIYRDNFSKDAKLELEESGQKDEYNQRLFQNADTSGRYHSDWLSNLYPRIKLARNLLSHDGLIFISIDDNEVHNLKKICDEIFGEENFINTISVNMKNVAGASGGGEDRKLKKNIEYLHVYAKSRNDLPALGGVYDYKPISELVEEYREQGKSWKYTSILYDEGEKQLVGTTETGSGDNINIYECVGAEIKTIKQIIREEGISEEAAYNKYAAEIFEAKDAQSSIRTRVIESREKHSIDSDIVAIDYVPRTGRNKGKLYTQYYKGEKCRLFAWLKDVGEFVDGVLCKKDKLGTFWDLTGQINNLTKEGDIQFSNGKKPISLINNIIKLFPDSEKFIVLDFFSGSATTAHATMQLNAEDGSNRKHIMVQLPEATDEKSESYKEGYKNICEIGKERIRRAGAKIKEETGADIDYGFRVYRLDESNMADVYHTPQDYDQDKLELFADNVKEDRSPDDLLAQIMLDWGLPLSLPIEEASISGKRVFHVAGNSLLACFDSEIDEDFAKEIAKEEPLRIVFKDAGFASDTSKSNVKQLLKQLSPETEMKVI